MVFKKAFWLTMKNLLSSYAKKQKIISRCYIRHSAAFGPQNPFLSDFDVTFFVTARDIDELRKARKQIKRDFQKISILQDIIKHSIFLPATKNAYDLCKEYYPFRSIYPMETWLSVNEETPAASVSTKFSLPLDYIPENFMSCYIIPVLMGKRRRHIFERAFFMRNLKKDYLWTKISCSRKNVVSFYEALLAEIDIWGQFYKNIKFVNSNEKITFHQCDYFNYTSFFERWRTVSDYSKNSGEISSLWIYPTSHNDNLPNVSLNLKASISAKTCQKTINTVLKTFGGLDYTLLLGTEESMIGRINGLSRISLLDPWLFKYHGYCLVGDPGIKGKIKEPNTQMLKEKYREFLFSFMFSTRFICRNSYPYAMYRLCFTLDHLFKHREMIVDNDELAEIYGPEFIPKEKFRPLEDTGKLFAELKEKHAFDLFGN
jgi:hypothetical protein